MKEYNERKWWIIDWLCWEYYGTLFVLIKAFFKGCQLMHPVRLLFLLFLVVFEKTKVRHKKYEIWTRSRYEGGKKEKKNWYHLPVKWNKQTKKTNENSESNSILTKAHTTDKSNPSPWIFQSIYQLLSHFPEFVPEITTGLSSDRWSETWLFLRPNQSITFFFYSY